MTTLQFLGRRLIALMLVLYVFSHALGILIYYLLALAVDIRLSILVIGWLRSLLGVIQMLPVSVAGLGVREVSLVVLLGDYGVPQTQAVSYSLAIFSLMVVGGVVGGVLEGWDLLQSRRSASRAHLLRQEGTRQRISTKQTLKEDLS